MPHLKHIGLTNFRVFGERTDIALAPLTILTGTNSSGKSSVLKAMQLLQENIADIGFLNFSDGEHKLGNFAMTLNRNAKEKTMAFSLPFDYEGQKDKMYMDWIYNLDASNELQYGKLSRISVCLKKDKREVIGITPWNNYNIDFGCFLYDPKKSNFWINIPETSLRECLREHYLNYRNGGYLYSTLEKKIKSFKTFNTEDSFLDYVINLLSKIKEKLRLKYHFKSDEELTQLLNVQCLTFDITEYERAKSIFQNMAYDGHTYMENGVINNNSEPYKNPNDFLRGLEQLSVFDWFFADIDNDEKFDKDKYGLIYDFMKFSRSEDAYNVLNSQGSAEFFYPFKAFNNGNSLHENAAFALREAFELKKNQKKPFKILQKDNFYYLEAVRANTQRVYTWQSQGTPFNQLLLDLVKSKQDWQLNFINYWLKEFGIGNELKIILNEFGIGGSIAIDDKPLADLGYGVTQFLPILVKIVTIVKGEKRTSDVNGENSWVFEDKKILYIEEPETNLHPKLQSKLADMFVDACKKFNLQIIVETHSEYLIRKLQYLTAKKEITPQMTVIHYFYDPKEERPEGEPQVKQINIQTDGRLTGQFGAGFYDETARLMTAILTGETLN